MLVKNILIEDNKGKIRIEIYDLDDFKMFLLKLMKLYITQLNHYGGNNG